MTDAPPSGFSLFADCSTTVGEGPLWSERERALYWIDVYNGEVFRKSYPSNAPADYERFKLNVGKIGGCVFAKDGSLLVFAAAGRVWNWRPGTEPTLRAELKVASDTRFNDVVADPVGRVFCGVAPLVQGGDGSLWRMDADGSFVCIEPVTKGMPNGLGFSPDRSKLYFTVTQERTIYRYDYERTTGAVSGRVPFVKVPETEGFPDGMTVDSEGCVWSAQWNGSRLVRYSEQGEKLREWLFPIAKVSCVAFGGPRYKTVFVSTANQPWAEADYLSQKAGSVFKMEQKIRGLPEFEI